MNPVRPTNLIMELIYIAPKNLKMGLPTWSIPAISTCPGCTKSCAKECYARKAERQYPSVLPRRKANLEATKRGDFVHSVNAWLAKRSPDFFRIHESGDFYDQPYLDKWLAICRANPGTKFLAFTKSFHLDFSMVPQNLTVVWSIWPDTDMSKVPSGPRAYAVSPGSDRDIHCPGRCDGCMVCWHLGRAIKRNVWFTIH